MPRVDRELAGRAAAKGERAQGGAAARVEHEDAAGVGHEGASRRLVHGHRLGAAAHGDGADDAPGRRVERGHAAGGAEDEDAAGARVHRQRDGVAAHAHGAQHRRREGWQTFRPPIGARATGGHKPDG